MFKLVKSFRFEAAHRLAKGYPDKCKNIHGHSFSGELVVNCQNLDHFDMGVDFSVLKNFLNGIESKFDHKLLLYEKDDALISLCLQQDWEIFTFPQNPTSEVIAAYIYDEACIFVKKNNYPCSIKEVRISETCTSCCHFSRP